MVIDATDAKPADVNKELERAARLLNLYGASGLAASDVKVVVVFYGEATRTVLNDTAYKAKFGVDKNPNLAVIGDLRKAGVEVFVCGRAHAYKGFEEADAISRVRAAAAALTVIVNRQNNGYAYVPAP